MFFKRINENTINCIITPEDLSEQGIQLEDLFERKEEAMAFLRRVILEAAREENFTLKGDNASMRISVLPDHSISLTLSDGVPANFGEGKTVQDVIDQIRSRLNASSDDNKDKQEADYIAAGQNAADANGAGKGGSSARVSGSGNMSSKRKKTANASSRTLKKINEYGYIFYSMPDVIDCCRSICDIDCYDSSLYINKEAGEYYLILRRKGTDTDALFERVVLSLNEFADPIDDGAEYLAYVKEHEKCLLKENAAQQLAQI